MMLIHDQQLLIDDMVVVVHEYKLLIYDILSYKCMCRQVSWWAQTTTRCRPTPGENDSMQTDAR